MTREFTAPSRAGWTLASVVLALGLFGAAGCSCGGSTGGGGRPCTTSADCGAGQMCIDGTCTRRDDEEDSGTVEPGCMDSDGDGFGEGCSAGLDCDDSNPQQGAREICDGLDNDCDGIADNGVLSPCGDCDPSCEAEGTGVGTDDPFDLDMDEADGVGLDDAGAIVLDSRRVNTNFIWIANTPQGSVSRFSTTPPYDEVARYYTGPDGGGNDPSRTSVNSLGDVYVGNRNGNSLSRISVLGGDCPDTNGDGSVTTSLSGAELLPWGSDDCVLWTTELDSVFPGEAHVRAVAAQDVEGPDGELRQYVWVGGYDTRLVAKLDGETGAVILVTPAPARPYGFALDGMGNLWISTREGNILSRIDTTRCVDEASCAADPCEGEGPGFDECVKQRIGAPRLPYGVTVDFNQRVWLGGDDVMRYVPTDPPGSRWQTVGLPWGGIQVHGIAADAEGWVWGAAQGNGVVRIDSNNPTTWMAVAGTGGLSNKGMAVDAEGKIWSITQADRAVVITPGAGIADATVDTNVARSVVTPYTYSDMTGLQLRLATNPRGYYRHIYEGCDEGTDTEWGELRWVAETPAGTEVTFRAKTAATRAGLDAAEWVTVATVPPDATPGSLGDAFAAAGVTVGRFVMIEAILRAERTSATEVITPRVLNIDVTYVCPPEFG